MRKVDTGYIGTSELEHGLCVCTVDNPLTKLGDYLSVQAHKPCSISHLTLLNRLKVTKPIIFILRIVKLLTLSMRLKVVTVMKMLILLKVIKLMTLQKC